MQIIIPATSANLGPGFDCLGLSLKFFNKISIKRSKISSISISGEGEKNIFLRKNNSFVRIFNENYSKLLGKQENFSFKFENQIPISRGLGSSSAVIVSAIASAYFMADKNVDKTTILNEALKYESHPDNIAPASLGGFVCSLVEKGKVLSIKKEIDKDLKAVLVIPNKIMKTEQSRSVLPKKISFDDAVFNLSHSSFLTACFLEKKYELLREASKDRLHQDKRMKNYDVLFEVQELALKNNALLSTLSGSGSSFLNITYKDDAELLSQKLKDKFKNFVVKILEFDDKGFEFL
ncbi:homoserine kinase [uncultured Campylobacter sp.]|uniref:homoserine kinase n=1 Tax=uncultured Campylobacter sp. TaxID=218934 RepID=UPI0026341B0C|nr:homoserine kinase [uncultured Campylobacter sp.]